MYVTLSENELEEIKGSTTYACCFNFLNVGLALYCDDKEPLQIFKGIYYSFITETLPEEFIDCYVLQKSKRYPGLCLVVADKLYRLGGGGGFDWAEMMIFQRIMELMENYLLLHAGVVSREGRAYIIYAPSRFGKTTLILNLVSRGYHFLSDEFCPVRMDDLTIMPFPRRVGLKQDSPFYPQVNKSNAFYLAHEQKLFLDCHDIFPGKTGKGSRAKCLIILSQTGDLTEEPEDDNSFYEMLLFNDNPVIIDYITQQTEIEIVHKYKRGYHMGYRLHIPRNKSLVTAFQEIWKKFENDIFCVGKVSESKPDFSCSPVITKMPKSEAVFEILIQLLNRSHSGRLMKKFSGKTMPVLMEVGRLINNVDCYRMKPGTLDEMADIIDNL
jgi:hypothetical protein